MLLLSSLQLSTWLVLILQLLPRVASSSPAWKSQWPSSWLQWHLQRLLCAHCPPGSNWDSFAASNLAALTPRNRIGIQDLLIALRRLGWQTLSHPSFRSAPPQKSQSKSQINRFIELIRWRLAVWLSPRLGMLLPPRFYFIRFDFYFISIFHRKRLQLFFMGLRQVFRCVFVCSTDFLSVSLFSPQLLWPLGLHYFYFAWFIYLFKCFRLCWVVNFYWRCSGFKNKQINWLHSSTWVYFLWKTNLNCWLLIYSQKSTSSTNPFQTIVQIKCKKCIC